MTKTLMQSPPRQEPAPGPAEPILTVVLDHAHARLFLVDDEHASELPCLVSPRMRGGKFRSDWGDSPGWGEAAFHGRRREEERRHYALVTKRISALVLAHKARAIVLGGADPVVAALKHALPARLSKLVVGTVRLNPTALTAAQVRTSVREARSAGGLAAQDQIVSAAVEGFGTGRAVDGLRAVLLALARDQVQTLLVAQRGARAGYRCATSGRLVLTKPEAQGEAVIREPDLIAAAMAEARRLGGAVVEIGDARQAARMDGVAALLRFR
jgi:peptide subunit release factor 1 (eRF1)